MINLSFIVDNIDSVMLVYKQIQVQRSATETGTFTTVSGIGFPIILVTGQSDYVAEDPDGCSTTWYKSRYYNPDTSVASAWSDPILGESGSLCYSPTYPDEVAYGTSDKLTIDTIRKFCGDPIGLKREYNEKDNIHEGGLVYQMDEKGWPCSVTVGDVTYNSTANPTVNGYLYLKFSDDITTFSGVDLDINIFYYTFRHSDREIMEAYDTCFSPPGLTTVTATSECYILQTAIDLLTQELWEDTTEDGAAIRDDTSHYNPDGGQKIRNELIDKLQKRLDKLAEILMLKGVQGVRLD